MLFDPLQRCIPGRNDLSTVDDVEPQVDGTANTDKVEHQRLHSKPDFPAPICNQQADLDDQAELECAGVDDHN